MSHEDRSYDSTQQPSYHVHAVEPLLPAPPTSLAPPQPPAPPSSSPPGPHAPSTPLPESMNTLPQFMTHQLRGDPESHQFDDAEESSSARPHEGDNRGTRDGAEIARGLNEPAPPPRPTWVTAPNSSPPPAMPTSSADPIIASERDEIDDSLVIADSQIDVPSPRDSTESPPPVRTPRKAVAAASTSTTPNRTPLSKLQPPLPTSRSLNAHRSLVSAVPPQPRLEFAPPPKRAKTTTPQKVADPESEDSFAGNPPKIPPSRRLQGYLEKSDFLPIPPEMMTKSQMYRDADALEEDGRDADESTSIAMKGLPVPFRAASPVSPSPPKRTIILPPSSASDHSPPKNTVILPPSSDEQPAPPIADAEMSSASTRSTGPVMPPRRFMPSQDESDDSPSKKSQLFSSQSDNNALFASESQFSYTFQATQFNTMPTSSPAAQPSSGNAQRESNGTEGSKQSNHSIEEATQIVSDLSQRRTAEYLGPIYPSVPSPIVRPHSPATTSPAIIQIQPNRRLGRRPASAISEGVPSPATIAAPELPALPNGHQPNGKGDPPATTSPVKVHINPSRRLGRRPPSSLSEVLRLAPAAPPSDAPPREDHPTPNGEGEVVPVKTLSPSRRTANAVRQSSLTPPPTAKVTSPIPDQHALVATKPMANTDKQKGKRPALPSSPPASDDEPVRRPSKRARRPPTRFTPEPEAPAAPAAPHLDEDVDMEAEDDGSDDDQPVRKSVNKGKGRARIPESQQDEPTGHSPLRVDEDASEDELLLRSSKAKATKKRIPVTPSPAENGHDSDLSEPATPPDPDNSDYESFHPTKKALSARQQQLAGNGRGKRNRDISTTASSKSKFVVNGKKPRRMTRSSIDSSERLTTPSSISSGANREVRVMAFWSGSPSGWYIGHLISSTGDRYTVRFEDKTEATVTLDDIRRCELRQGDSVWALGPKAMKKKGELVVAADWGLGDAGYRAGPKVTTKSGHPAGSILPKNIYIKRHDPPQEFSDRLIDPAELDKAEAAPIAGPSTAAPSKAPSTRAASPTKTAKAPRKSTGSGTLTGKTFLVTAASESGHDDIDNLIRAHGGMLKDRWEDLFLIPPHRFGSTLRKSVGAPFVVFCGSGWKMSPKFMVALAAGIPVVGAEYIEAIANGQDADWRGYLMTSGYSGIRDRWCSQCIDPSWGDDEWTVNGAINTRRPFSGKSFVFLEPKKEGLKDLVPFCLSALGAASCLMARRIDTPNTVGVDYLVAETRESWKGNVAKALHDDERLCSIQWLKECLITGAALDSFKDLEE